MITNYSTDRKNVSFSDIFIKNMLKDFNDESVLDDIDEQCVILLSFYSNNYNSEIEYFSYDIDISKDGSEIIVKANNILTALWFNGIYPSKYSEIIKNNKYTTNRGTYTFNKKTKKLSLWK